MRDCDICHRIKVELTVPNGLLQPLPILDLPWIDISMDFIESLPVSKGHLVLWVVVERLTKYSLFVPLSHLYTVKTIAQLFQQPIFKLHGFPRTIFSNKNPVLTSTFWRELFKLHDVQLCHSTAYHPQSDG